ncbi:MAG: acetyl-CoA carboxylase biotin carboxyl carrier protein subunit [Flavobacteriaceae bacterium]|nr:acetyl-CoA carboxylase biotin carboxyl carrier protein subunit [Flavobacteriaceae bacterium]
MSDSYKVKVNENFNFEITNTSAQNLDAVSVTKNKFHILHSGQSVFAEIVSTNFTSKKYTVKINNTLYEVSIANALDQLIKEMGFEVGASKQVNAIKAPMPGLILEVSVSEGQEVQENDPLLILEAMKMENSIVSPRSGKIKSVSAIKGAAVEKGQLLIEFE